MKSVLVTGAFGFAGANLVEHLSDKGYKVYAVGREGSSHNDRLSGLENVVKVCCEMADYARLPEILEKQGAPELDYLVHLAWGGDRKDMHQQFKNVEGSMAVMDAAKALGVKRFIGIGSQAEYGVKEELITEDLEPEPIDAYGSCKLAAYYLLKSEAVKNEIEFIWGRIFSLIGRYEPAGRMLPDLVARLKRGDGMELSSCEQYWDYLDAEDAADAIIALLEKGRAGEIYNIANGDYRPLKEFTDRAAAALLADPGLIGYGDRPRPFISLKASSEKIQNDTGWKPVTSFEETVKKYDII